MRWCHICNSWQKNQKEIPFKFQFSINAKGYFPYCAFPSNLLTKRQSSDPLPEAASLHSSRANKFVIWISGTGSITFSWTLKGSQQSAMVFYRINANRMLLLIRTPVEGFGVHCGQCQRKVVRKYCNFWMTFGQKIPNFNTTPALYLRGYGIQGIHLLCAMCS